MNERERLVELLNKSWQFYFCEVCGKEQYVEKGGATNEAN